MSASGGNGRPLVYREASAASTSRTGALSAPSDGRCGCCAGTGEHPCGHECGSCDGSGRNPDSPVCTLPHGGDCTCSPGALKRLIPDERIEAGLNEIRAEADDPKPELVWQCTRCELTLAGNPRFCWGCGYTVYRPTWEPEES